MYSTPLRSHSNGPERALVIAGHPSQADLMVFVAQYRPDAEAATFASSRRAASGAVDGWSHLDLGASLDTRYNGADGRMAYQTLVTYYDRNSCGSVEGRGWLAGRCTTPSPAITRSLGSASVALASAYSGQQLQRFAKL